MSSGSGKDPEKPSGGGPAMRPLTPEDAALVRANTPTGQPPPVSPLPVIAAPPPVSPVTVVASPPGGPTGRGGPLPGSNPYCQSPQNRVNKQFISNNEGGQHTQGYVPPAQGGGVDPHSGVT